MSLHLLCGSRHILASSGIATFGATVGALSLYHQYFVVPWASLWPELSAVREQSTITITKLDKLQLACTWYWPFGRKK